MSFRPAERKRSKLRLGISGPAGSGKTASALLIAYGITNDWSKIGLVDTESGSGELYVNTTIGGTNIGQYNVMAITPPFEPQKYINAIKLAERSGIEVIILDSISHAWTGEGGLLDIQGKAAARPGNNSYTAWREVTPMHNRFIDAMLQSSIHVIATMRSKQDYIQEKDERTGKNTVRKLGMAPVQRDGMDYEFTIVFDLSYDHVAGVSKDRTSLFDGKYFTPTPETGELMKSWLDAGPEPAKEPAKEPVKESETKPEKFEAEEKSSEPVKEPAEPAEPTGEVLSFNIMVMSKVPRKERGREMFGVQAVIIDPSEYEGEVKLIVPANSKALLVDGAALEIQGVLNDSVLEAVSAKPVDVTESAEPAKTVETGFAEILAIGQEITTKLKSNVNPGKFAIRGEKVESFFAFSADKEDVVLFGDSLEGLSSNDIIKFVIDDLIEGEMKTLVVVSSVEKIEKSA